MADCGRGFPAAWQGGGRSSSGAVNPGICASTSKLPETGTYNLSAIVDWPRGTFEENDTNNRFDLRYTAPPNATRGAPTPTPTPGTHQADLFASGISVKGEQSGGTSGCDPGKNGITVFIKNLGGAPAANFFVSSGQAR